MTQQSRVRRSLLRGVKPCSLWLYAQCSDTKTSTTLFLTRRRGDTETHPPRKTEPMIAGRLRLIRTQGHNNKHAHNGIRLRHGAKSVVLCTHSLVNDEEPFLAYGADPTPPLHVKTTSFPSTRSGGQARQRIFHWAGKGTSAVQLSWISDTGYEETVVGPSR